MKGRWLPWVEQGQAGRHSTPRPPLPVLLHAIWGGGGGGGGPTIPSTPHLATPPCVLLYPHIRLHTPPHSCTLDMPPWHCRGLRNAEHETAARQPPADVAGRGRRILDPLIAARTHSILSLFPSCSPMRLRPNRHGIGMLPQDGRHSSTMSCPATV